MRMPKGRRILPGCPESGALPSPTARPLGCAAGADWPLAVGAGGARVGTRDQPESARSCVLAWRAVGAARGRPGGGASCLGAERPGLDALPLRPLLLSGLRPGPTTHWLWVRGLLAWKPVTNPTARALASWLCALWRRHEGTHWPLAWVWGVRDRALSHPRPRVLSGVRPGPTTHWLWPRGVRAWGPVTNPTAPALLSWLCALWERHEGARGGRLLPGCGASRVGRSPPATLVPPVQRAEPARRSARGGVDDGSPRPRAPAPTASKSQAPAARPKGRVVGGRIAPDPGCFTPRQEAPPPGRPRAAPRARKASSQERALRGW